MCEWDPDRKQPAETGAGCQNHAAWSVGKRDRNIHLCESCAALPCFKRLKSRKALPGPSQWEAGKAAIARAIAEIYEADRLFRKGGHLSSLYLTCRFRRVALKIQTAIANT